MTTTQYKTHDDGSRTVAGVSYTYSTYCVMPQNIYKIVVREDQPIPQEPTHPEGPNLRSPKARTGRARSGKTPAQRAEEGVILVMYENEPITTQAREDLITEAMEILMENGFLQDRRPWDLSQIVRRSGPQD